MNKNYFIVNDRAFTSIEKAIKYCEQCNITTTCIIETKVVVKQKYYLLKSESTLSHITSYRYYTEAEIEKSAIKEMIEQLKSGDYFEKFISLKEISEEEYICARI